MNKLSKIQKIELIESIPDKIVSKEEILKTISNVLHEKNSNEIFNSLRRINKIEYLFQNYYYILTEEERIKKRKNYSTLELIAVVLNKLNIKWYFGLETANDLNKIVWQPSKIIHIINNKLSKKIRIENQEIIFHKFKKELIKDYIIHKTPNRIQLHISSNKKTLFDFIYLKKNIPNELKEVVNRNG